MVQFAERIWYFLRRNQDDDYFKPDMITAFITDANLSEVDLERARKAFMCIREPYKDCPYNKLLELMQENGLKDKVNNIEDFNKEYLKQELELSFNRQY